MWSLIEGILLLIVLGCYVWSILHLHNELSKAKKEIAELKQELAARRDIGV